LLRPELHRLEKLTGEILSNENLSGKSSSYEEGAEGIKSIRSECIRLKEIWLRELFSPVKDHVIIRYVRYHQTGITQLSNRLCGQMPASGSPDRREGLHGHCCRAALDELEQLLYFLQSDFNSYFDFDSKLSDDQCRKQMEHIGSLEEAVSRCLNHAAIDLSLMAAISLSVGRVISQALYSGISYRQSGRSSSLLAVVLDFLNQMPDVSTADVVSLLYRENFNTSSFTSWYREHLDQKISAAADPFERAAIIRREINSLEAVFVAPEKAFDPALPGTGEQILQWLREQDTGAPGSKPVKTNGNYRIPLTISVAQFGLFLRLFYQAGCFPVNNISKMLRFFRQHFSSKKQDDISLKSLGRAFYNADQSTAAVVRDYLQKMINHLNKTYFP